MNPIALSAFHFAKIAREKEGRAQTQKLQLLERLAQLEAEIENHKAAADRLGSFQKSIDGVYQCPRCWIGQEVAAGLVPVHSLTGDDKFQCGRCRDEFSVPE